MTSAVFEIVKAEHIKPQRVWQLGPLRVDRSWFVTTCGSEVTFANAWALRLGGLYARYDWDSHKDTVID